MPKFTGRQKFGIVIAVLLLWGLGGALLNGGWIYWTVGTWLVWLAIFGVALLLFFYKPNPAQMAAKAAAKLAKNQAKLTENQALIDSLLAKLGPLTGARAVVATNELRELLRKLKTQNAEQKLDELLASINFDKSRITSRHVGDLDNFEAGIWSFASKAKISIYKDWVIAGSVGYDFDVSTRGEVTLDGSISYDSKNKPIDNRVATLQLATKDWSHSFKINPNAVPDARRILNQLLAIIEDLKPKSISVADIESAMSKIVSETGKSPAEKLEELSNLRYQRLLSDAEFEQAKSRILGI
jgi:hypothetical protein